MLRSKIYAKRPYMPQLKLKLNSLNCTIIYFLIALIPLLGGRVLDSLVLLLILNVFLDREIGQNLKRNLYACLLLLQYPLLQILRVVIEKQNGRLADFAPANYDLWVWSIVAIVLSAAFISQKRSALIIKYVTPASIYFTFAIIFYLWLGSKGRIEPFGHPVFYAPLFTTHLVLLYVSHSIFHISCPKFRHVFPIVLVFVIAIAFSQTRGIFVAQIVVFSLLSLFLMAKKKFRWGLWMLSSSAVGIVIGISLLTWADKSALTRVTAILDVGTSIVVTQNETVSNESNPQVNSSKLPEIPKEQQQPVHTSLSNHLNSVAERIESSSSFRLQMWSVALTKTVERPLLGHGPSMETEMLNDAGLYFKHVHNIYLSWLIWGGALTLLSGLVFFFAVPIAVFINSQSIEMRFLPFCVSMFWPTTMMFDSFFVFPAFNYVYILLTILTFSLMRNSAEHDESAIGKP